MTMEIGFNSQQEKFTFLYF